MIRKNSLVVTLILLVDEMPAPKEAPRRGRPKIYSDRLILKSLIIMVLKRFTRVHELWIFLNQPQEESMRIRFLLSEQGRFPSRRTFERRLKKLPEDLPKYIGHLGRYLVELIDPWRDCGRAVAIDSSAFRAKGGVWHKKDKEAGRIPDSRIDTEADWTKSEWHGWVYGWKLHMIETVSDVWIPLAAEFTPANVADNKEAPSLIDQLPKEARFVLGDTTYQDHNLYEHCANNGHILVTSRRGSYPHNDPGVKVRRIFHLLRFRTIENGFGQFKLIFDLNDRVPTKGYISTARFVLGAVLLYQVVLLHRIYQGSVSRVGMKAIIRAA